MEEILEGHQMGSESGQNIVTCRPVTRQRLDKHIPEEAYERNDRTSISIQRISQQAFSKIETLCFLRGPCRGFIKGPCFKSETVKYTVYCTLYIVKDRPVLSSERAPHLKKPQWSDIIKIWS
jgi:hypothetical protein